MEKKKKNCWRYHLRICTKKRNIMMYASWDMESGRHNFLSFWAIFCPITPILTLKINIWKKLKSAWKYYPFTRVQLKWRSCDVWFLRYKAGWTVFFVILCHFLLFDPPNNPKNQSFEKMKKKKTPGDIILRLHTTNDHMMYGSWDTEHDRVLCYFALLPH